MTFGLQCDEPTSVAALDRAAEGGIDFIDTSDAYPLGVIPYHPIAGDLRSGKHPRAPHPRKTPVSPSATPREPTRTGTGTTESSRPSIRSVPSPRRPAGAS
ncbi:MAG TPA: hypothetical protein VMU75_08900 [Acidimicrobiales bacterium]|nr:hypothetical protein [Acidimicrobiales bacterium]